MPGVAVPQRSGIRPACARATQGMARPAAVIAPSACRLLIVRLICVPPSLAAVLPPVGRPTIELKIGCRPLQLLRRNAFSDASRRRIAGDFTGLGTPREVPHHHEN